MGCGERNCDHPAQVAGLCRRHYHRKWHAEHPGARAGYMAGYWERNPTAKAAYNARRHGARRCRRCAKPVARRIQVCAECKRWEQQRLARIREQIGHEVADGEAVALLEAIASDPCAYCGGPSEAIDHVDPRSRGGELSIDNVAATCQSCNSRKHARTLLGFLMVERLERDLRPLADQRELARLI